MSQLKLNRDCYTAIHCINTLVKFFVRENIEVSEVFVAVSTIFFFCSSNVLYNVLTNIRGLVPQLKISFVVDIDQK